MSNEINVFYQAGYTLYSAIRNTSGQTWNTTTEAFEAWAAPGDYDISLTDKTAGMYVGDFPTGISPGYYIIISFHQVGASPAAGDLAIYKRICAWNGTDLEIRGIPLSTMIMTLPAGLTLYAVGRNESGQVWYPAGEDFEDWGTGSRTAADYDMPLTDYRGSLYLADFDTNMAAGYYHLICHQQAGGSPADTDPALEDFRGYWDGTNWWMEITSGDMASDTPLTLAELKNHLVVDHNEDDALILQLAAAATKWAEDFQNRTFLTRSRTHVLDAFPSVIRPPYAPLISVSSIEYVDSEGDTQTLAAANYRVDTENEPGRITLAYGQSWPSIRAVTNAVTITYRAGYGGAASVPDDVKAAIKLLVGHWYRHREDVGEGMYATIPHQAESLLWADRILL